MVSHPPHKKHKLSSLDINPETIDDDSEDSDFQDAPARASPSKRTKRTSSKKKSRGSRSKKKRSNSYSSVEDGSLSEDLTIWSASEPEEPVEMNSKGRPLRTSTKQAK